MNATRIALKNVGEWTTIGITAAEQVPVGRFPEYSFVGMDADEQHVDLRVPKASADKQLARLNLTLPATVGTILKFSRGENKTDASKPYWNIDLVQAKSGNGASGPSNGGGAGSHNQQPTTPPAVSGASSQSEQVARAAAAPAKPKATGHELYEKITDYVLATIKPKYDKAGIGLSPESAAAICATLYIGAQKNGH